MQSAAPGADQIEFTARRIRSALNYRSPHPRGNDPGSASGFEKNLRQVHSHDTCHTPINVHYHPIHIRGVKG